MGCQNSVDLAKIYVNIWNIVESYIYTYLQVCTFQPVNQYEFTSIWIINRWIFQTIERSNFKVSYHYRSTLAHIILRYAY